MGWEQDAEAARKRREVGSAGDAARTRGAEASASRTEAELPTVRGQAEATLANTRQGMTLAQQKALDDLRGQFEKTPAYVKYNLVVPALATALHTDENPAGDIALTYAAAKIFDPDSAVRDAEQAALGNTSNYLDAAVQQIKKQFDADDSGTFSPRARERLRAEIIRKTRSLNMDYGRVREQYAGLATGRGYDPVDVIGTHIGATFMPDLQSYDDKLRAAHDEDGGRAVDAVSDQIAGEPIKGYRLTPANEAEVLDYVRSPDATPEGYADLLTAKTVEEGHITEDERDDFHAANLVSAQTYFGGLTPEQRTRIPAGLDYTEVDRKAQEEAGAGDVLLQAGRNIPESAVQLAEGAIAPIKDTITSIAAGERQGLIKVLPDVAGETLQRAFSDVDTPTTDAMLQVLGERYGSGQGAKNTLATDPLGLLADASMFVTGGGTAASRLPGVAGRIGEGVATVGRAMDPINNAASLVRQIPNAAAKIPPSVVRAGVDAPTALLALPSGVGGPTLRGAASAGFERGRAGAPTPGSEAFLENMRNPQSTVDDVVTTARNAIGNLRQAASDRYRMGMAQFGGNPVPLDINVVRQRMQAIRPDNYDAMLDAPTRPSSHLAWDQMNQTVEHYAARAAQDPSLLLPLAMDTFKQDLYDIGSKIGGAFDKDAARIARTAYNGVRDELVHHDPFYAEVMGDYERAAQEVQQLEQTFSLAAARGKEVNVDTVTRKLQSILRNNANTNYGQRAALGERLAALDPTGTLMPSLAGQSASAWPPRGLQTAVGTGVGTGLGLSGTASVPALAAAIPAFSPRAVGELAYGTGRAAGTVARGVDKVMPLVRGMADLQRKHPASTLAAAQLGSYAEGADNALQPDPASPPVSLGESELEIDPVTGKIRLPDGRLIDKEDLAKLMGVEAFAEGGPVSFADYLKRKGGPSVEQMPLPSEAVADLSGRRAPRRAPPPPEPGIGDRLAALAGRVVASNPAVAPLLAGPFATYEGLQPGGWLTDPANAARLAGRGVTFATNDEMEAGVRAPFSDRSYREIKDDIATQEAGYEEAHPAAAVGLEVGGALGSGILLPATVEARLAQLATRYPALGRLGAGIAERYAPLAERSRLARLAPGLAEDVAMSSAYGAGRADTTEDILPAAAEENLYGIPFYAGLRGTGAAARWLKNKMARP